MTTTSNSTSIILYKYKEDKYSWKLIFHSQVTDKLGSLIQTTQSKTEGKTDTCKIYYTYIYNITQEVQ